MKTYFIPIVYLKGRWRDLDKYAVVAKDIIVARKKIKDLYPKQWKSWPYPVRFTICITK